MPEVAIRLEHFSEWERSYAHVLLYPPQPAAMLSLESRQVSFSAKMYGAYLEEKRQQVSHGVPIDENYVLESIVAPGEKIAPTYLNQMPANFGQQLGAKELDALVRFVRQLDEVVDANGELRPEPEPTTN